MRIIHCTQKLLKQLDRNIIETDKIPTNPEGPGNWYANLLWFNRRKCVLLTNEKSLYSFLIPKFVQRNLEDIETEFLIHLTRNLQYEGISLEAINKVHQEYLEIGFAKASNRSVLGSMNDFRYQYEHFIMSEGGIEQAGILQIYHKMNRTPMSAIKYKYPIDGLRSLL